MAAFVLSASVTSLQAAEPVTPPPSARDAFARFANVLEVLQQNYLEPGKIRADAQMTAACREFVRSLDTEADFLTPDELTASTNADVGLHFTMRDDVAVVIAAVTGSSAQRAGILPGDEILAVDGKPTARTRAFGLANQLRGTAGSRVTLRVRDPATGTIRDYIMTRALPAAPTPLKFLAGGVAYYHLPEFTNPNLDHLRTQLAHAETEHARALILDLRNNPGGLMTVTLDIAKLFLKSGVTILTLQYASPTHRTPFKSDTDKPVTTPLVLLTNAGTADEAEVFAAALRDNNRARLVGTPTNGRGRLCSTFPLPEGGTLYLPTALYVTPAGKTFDKTGLTPDVLVETAREIERHLAATGFGSLDWIKHSRTVLTTDLSLTKALELLAK